jgi:multidrug efflux pump subunit AcrB
VLVSAFVALTLSPMMCRFLLQETRRAARTSSIRITEPFFVGMTHGYRLTLGAPVIRWRWLAIPILLGNGALIWWLGGGLPSRARPARGPREHPREHHRARRRESFEYTAELDGQDLRPRWTTQVPEDLTASFAILGGGGGRSEANAAVQNIYLKARPSANAASVPDHRAAHARHAGQFTGVRAIATHAAHHRRPPRGQPLAFVLQAPDFDACRESCRSSSKKRPRARCSASSMWTSR